MATPGGLVDKQELIDAQLDTAHLGRVVNSKDASGAPISTSTNRTGGVNKTLDALEAEYQGDIDNFVQVSDQLILDKTAEFDASITAKEAEADAAIDAYRLLNKGPYATGIALESKFEFITYDGESYFASNPPYTTTATLPNVDANLFVGAYASKVEVDEGDLFVAQAVTNSNIYPSGGLFLSIGSQVSDVPSGKNALYVFTSKVELLYLYPPSGDFSSSGRTITDISSNSFGGYDVITNSGTFEFLTRSVLNSRGYANYPTSKREVYLDGWGAKSDATGDSAPALLKAIQSGLKIVSNPSDNFRFETTVSTDLNVDWDLNGGTTTSQWNKGVEGDSYFPTQILDADGNESIKIINGKYTVDKLESDKGGASSLDSDSMPLFCFRRVKSVRLHGLIDKYSCSLGYPGQQTISTDNNNGWTCVKTYFCESADIEIDIQRSNREGPYAYRSSNVKYKVKVSNCGSSFVTGWHAWYCDGVTVTGCHIDKEESKAANASSSNCYSTNVRVWNNYYNEGNGMAFDNEKGEVFTMKDAKVWLNTLDNTKIKGDIEENTIWEDVHFNRNTIKGADGKPNCIQIGAECHNVSLNYNTLIANGATQVIALRLSAYWDGTSTPQDISTDVSLTGNDIVGNGELTQTDAIDLGTTSRVLGLKIKGGKVRKCWTGIKARNLIRNATLSQVDISDLDIVIPDSYPASTSSGAGCCIFVTTDTSDITNERITVKDWTIGSCIRLDSSMAGVLFSMRKNAAKLDAVLDGLKVRRNDITANSESNNHLSVRVYGQDASVPFNNVKVDYNDLDTSSAAGTDIELNNCKDYSVFENDFKDSLYSVTLSGENLGTERISNNRTSNEARFRYGSGYVDSVTKRRNSGNVGAVSTGGTTFKFSDKGPTANRPTALNTILTEGDRYWDTTLKQNVYWDGSSWV